MREIIGIGHIQLEIDSSYEAFAEIMKTLDEYCIEYTGNENDRYISITMFGNNNINYDALDDIKSICKANDIDAEIIVSEYVECEDGYYWESDEE